MTYTPGYYWLRASPNHLPGNKQQVIPQVTAIIRSCGERTTALCRHLIARQVPEDNIVVVSEAPFSQAVKRTFEVGIERGLPWTLCIDADTLLRDGVVAELLKMAEQADSNVFVVNAKLLDKFFGVPRPAGPHLFRTALLAEALSYIPADGVSIRPETFVIRQMASQGYPWMEKDMVVGLHDYEQYYRDIYRKALVFAHKHRHRIPYFESLWRRLAGEDPDYQVALWGLRAGLIFDGPVELDVRQFPQEIDTLPQMQGWQEKGDLPPTALSGSEIARFIDTFVPPPEYWTFRDIMSPSSGTRETVNLITRLNRALSKTGWTRIVPWLVGWGLRRIGRVLQTWAES